MSPSRQVRQAAACDVERHRYEVANLKILDVAASLDRLAGDLVSKHHASRPCRAAPDHVLVGATDIRRYDLEDDAVIDRLSCRIAEGRKVDLLNFDAAGFEVNHPPLGDTVISCGSHSGLRRAGFLWMAGSLRQLSVVSGHESVPMTL